MVVVVGKDKQNKMKLSTHLKTGANPHHLIRSATHASIIVPWIPPAMARPLIATCCTCFFFVPHDTQEVFMFQRNW